MGILKCRVCGGDMYMGDEIGVVRHARCNKCGYAGSVEEKKEPEVVVIRRRRD